MASLLHPTAPRATAIASWIAVHLFLALSCAQAGDAWAVGEVRIELPELPEAGQTFVVPVRAETGGALVAALTLKIRWNAASATLVEVKGGLSTGATHPFVVNDRVPGQANISDINAPRSSGQGGASYNQAKRGRILLYELVLRRTGPAPIALGAELDAFHDPGEGAVRKPTAIGGGAFPRPVVVVGAGAGPVAALERPVGDTWMEPGAGETGADTSIVVVRTQLGGDELGRFSIVLRFDPEQCDLVAVRSGLGGGPSPSTDASLPGVLWVSGGNDVIGHPDDRSQVVLCALELRPMRSAGAAVASGPPLKGKVVSFHRSPGAQGEARPLGPLPLPRPIRAVWPSPR